MVMVLVGVAGGGGASASGEGRVANGITMAKCAVSCQHLQGVRIITTWHAVFKSRAVFHLNYSTGCAMIPEREIW